jgi:hypothetical protein
LHGFADASKKAYGAVIYLKYPIQEDSYLICSKSRVAPLNNVSIPRLELKAALLLSDIILKIK